MSELNQAKDAIQQAALVQWNKTRRGTVVAATGVGKTKIAIDAMLLVLQGDPNASMLLVTPFEELRDKGWPEELRKWTTEDEYNEIFQRTEFICYATIPKITGRHYQLVVFDEVHHLTELTSMLFQMNLVEYTLGLSATPPREKRDFAKYQIIQQYAPVIFEYKLDQGVEDGVVADFEIVVIVDALDSVSKNIQGGTKKNPFMTTEAKQYDFLDRVVKRTMAMADGPTKSNAIKFSLLRRTRFIYNLPSKTRLAKELIKRIPDNLRYIVFCGGIEQSRDIMGTNVYNSKDKHPNMLDKFKEDMDMKGIGVVNAVDEGHNIPMVDLAIIVQTNSNDRTMVQRLGRIVRIRPGHKAKAFILCTQQTQDEQWVKKALAEFPHAKIKVIRSNQIYTEDLFEK